MAQFVCKKNVDSLGYLENRAIKYRAYAQGGRGGNQHVQMSWGYAPCKYRYLILGSNLPDERPEPCGYPALQDGIAILAGPYNVVLEVKFGMSIFADISHKNYNTEVFA